MILIELINEFTFNEPAPNIVWLVDKNGLEEVILILEKLLKNENSEVHITNSLKIKLINLDYIYFIKNENGDKLVSINNQSMMSILPKNKWLKILSWLKELKKAKIESHIYVEFDDENYVEEANWVISYKDTNFINEYLSTLE